MRHRLLAAAVLASLCSPAVARDGAGYVGIEGGILFPRDMKSEVDSTRVQTVPTGQGLLGQRVTTTTATFGSGFVSDYKRGLDLDAIAGYDFGMFRVEGELGYKRTRLRDLAASPTLLADINTAPISGVTSDSFSLGRRTTVTSAMINALADVEVSPGISIYGGGGVGGARVKAFGDRDSAFAWQLIGGISTAISPNVDLGLKYRYFQTDRLRFDTTAAFTGPGGATSVSTFSNAAKFRSHSLLLSLMFNFGGEEAAPPPPPPAAAAAPPPPPPAMQTCPDGSMIDAMASCPPPAASPVRQGERG